MLPRQLDMPAARYAFAFLAIGEICQKLEGFISYRFAFLRKIHFAKTRIYRVRATREHIEFIFREHTSRKMHISTERKSKSKNRGFFPFILALSVRYIGLGLAHICITRPSLPLRPRRRLFQCAQRSEYANQSQGPRYEDYQNRSCRQPRQSCRAARSSSRQATRCRFPP